MIQVIFKNLKPSEIVRAVVQGRLSEAIKKFPDLKAHRIAVTLYVDNSPTQAGPDLFGVKLRVHGKKFRNLFLEKRSQHLYMAVSDLCEGLLERLNRATDRKRVKQRNSLRKFKRHLLTG